MCPSGKSNFEDHYEIDAGVVVKSNFVIITGCSGGGKSTILSSLSDKGYRIVSEPGRQIVKEQSAIGGEGLPWKSMDTFLELALSRYMHTFLIEKDDKSLVFFDRGVIDAVQSNRKQGVHFEKAAKKFRYHHRVFMLPPWEEIFKEDSERKHSFEDAVKEYESLMENYKRFGYEVILVPKTNVKTRIEFILKELEV